MRRQNPIKRSELKPIKLHPAQIEIFNSEARFTLAAAGTQAGKSYIGAIWITSEIGKYWSDDHLIAAPSYKILEQSTLPRFLDIAYKHIPGKWNEQKKTYSLYEGGTVYVRSADDPDSLESMTLRSAWADEAGKMKARVWPVFNSRLAIKLGRLLLTTTPYSQNWLYWEIYKRAKRGDKDYKCIQFTSISNPYFPKDEFERMRNTLSEEEFRRRFCGEFLKAEGLVYKSFNRDVNIVDAFEIPKEWSRFAGMDFGWTSPTAIIFCAISPSGDIYCYDEYYVKKKKLQDHAVAIFAKGFYDNLIYADKQAAQEIAELQSMNVRITAERDIGVNIGISRLDRLFAKNKLRVFSNLTNLIDEIETYSWEEDEDEVENTKDRVKKKKDHLVDALRYAIVSTPFMIPEYRQETYTQSQPRHSYNPITGSPIDGNDDNDFREQFNIYPLREQIQQLHSQGR